MSPHPSPPTPDAGEVLPRGEVRSVCVVVWRGSVTAPRFALQREALKRCVERFGKESAFLCIVEPKTTPPDEKLRRASVEMVAEHLNTLSCVACVIEGSGFSAAVTRSVLSGMHLLGSAVVRGRRTVPLSYFANVAEAASWMSSFIDIGIYERFLEDVERVRSR